ncbi:MAG: serine hydrolase [Saprospiraceae bacterium]
MKKSLAFHSIIIAFIAFAQPLFAQLTSIEIDSLVVKAMRKFDVVGTAVAIVKDGKIIYEKGFGIQSIETQKPVKVNTNFAIGSNSKAFTCAAIMMLVEDGKLKLTDKVKDHIPEFKMYNEYVTEHFIIEDLLTHRSGLGLGTGDLMLFPEGSDFKMHDLLTNFQYFKPVSEFRTKFDYDNILYMVAGEVIARASGMSYEKFIQKRIFDALSMDGSAPALLTIKDKVNLADPHSTTSGKLKKIERYGDMLNGAAGGIYSNVHDMSSWMIMHMNNGMYADKLSKQLFSAESHDEMWKIHTSEPAGSRFYKTHFDGYGLGWGLKDLDGNFSVSHTGGIPGMLSIVTMLPDMQLGITILTNTEAGGAGVFSAVSQTIIDSYIGKKDNNWVDKYFNYFSSNQNDGNDSVKKVWETVKNADKNAFKKEDYIGKYKDDWFGEIEISDKNGQLWFRSIRSPRLSGPMSFYKANSFAIKWEFPDMDCDAFAMFSLDEEGKATGFKMKGISPNIDFSYDFQDLEFKRIEK